MNKTQDQLINKTNTNKLEKFAKNPGDLREHNKQALKRWAFKFSII